MKFLMRSLLQPTTTIHLRTTTGMDSLHICGLQHLRINDQATHLRPPVALQPIASARYQREERQYFFILMSVIAATSSIVLTPTSSSFLLSFFPTQSKNVISSFMKNSYSAVRCPVTHGVPSPGNCFTRKISFSKVLVNRECFCSHFPMYTNGWHRLPSIAPSDFSTMAHPKLKRDSSAYFMFSFIASSFSCPLKRSTSLSSF